MAYWGPLRPNKTYTLLQYNKMLLGNTGYLMNEHLEIGLQNSTVIIQKLTTDNNYQVFAFTLYNMTSTFTILQESVFLTPLSFNLHSNVLFS